MSENQNAARKPASGASNNNDDVAGSNQAPQAFADKMDGAAKLLAELAEDAGHIAPEHKRTFEEAGAAIRDLRLLLEHAGEASSVTQILAAMPGVIISCERRVGDQVKKGDVIFVLDAMKVENPIRVPLAGKLISVRYGAGQRVAKGAVLAVIHH